MKIMNTFILIEGPEEYASERNRVAPRVSLSLRYILPHTAVESMWVAVSHPVSYGISTINDNNNMKRLSQQRRFANIFVYFTHLQAVTSENK